VTQFLRDRLSIVWLLLIAVTLLSAMIGGAHGFASAGQGAAATVAVLGIAFAKVWLVMSHFMDVRGAPRALKIICAVWLLAVLTILLAVYARILPL
jgi:cytochrome c oxidase subunit 4